MYFKLILFGYFFSSLLYYELYMNVITNNILTDLILDDSWPTRLYIDLQLMRLCFFFFSARLLSVLRGHSVFSSPPQRPMTSDFKGFSIPEFTHCIYFPILILEKEPVFSLFECSVLNKGTTGTIFIMSLV